MVEAAPGRLSTTTCCPRISLMRGARSRTTTSVAPPGAYGTITRIGFAGYVCACVTEPAIASSSEVTVSTVRLNLIELLIWNRRCVSDDRYHDGRRPCRARAAIFCGLE